MAVADVGVFTPLFRDLELIILDLCLKSACGAIHRTYRQIFPRMVAYVTVC
jgi:hypothetical protein